jgi:hypothetical protein
MTSEPTDPVGTRLMFENDRVRVWDLSLAPGESFAEHVHGLDYLLIVESGSLLRFVDPDQPEGHRDVQYADDQVTFRAVDPAGKLDRQLTNVGTKRHRNFIVELKKG